MGRRKAVRGKGGAIHSWKTEVKKTKDKKHSRRDFGGGTVPAAGALDTHARATAPPASTGK
jgi:hypothetical protein